MAHSPQTLEDFVRWGERRLRRADLFFGHGTDNPLDEAAWLVSATVGIPFSELEAQRGKVLTASHQDAVRQAIEERIHSRKPAAYLLHEAWFAGLRFYVDERVIVPRSHLGEFIVERFQSWIDASRVSRVLDLCTGSGCIAIACAHAFPAAQVDAVDISEDALAVARVNAEMHDMDARVRLVHSDLFAALDGRQYDLIVTNPPYVDRSDMESLPAEYRHEPRLALEAGDNGLDLIIRILAHASEHLSPEGVFFAEVGNSCTTLQAAFPDIPFTWLTTSGGDESVFMMTGQQLRTHARRFLAAAREG